MILKTARLCLLALPAAWLLPAANVEFQQESSAQSQKERPDRILYDSAMKELAKKRYERGRLLLQTLINTYDSSELLPKAHLAVAESWYKQGGARNLAQAQEACNQLILLYPASPEAKAAEEILQKIAEAGKKKR